MITVRERSSEDQEWILQVITENWGSTRIVTRGRIHDVENIGGYIAEKDGEPVGVLTFQIYGRECELISMNSLERGVGIGTALLDVLREKAKENECRGIWMITTNDNVDAMRFYQKKGFFFVNVHRDAVVAARRLKPEIPEIGLYGIPIRDEIELVMPL
jgi:N-acetylglutamate synthase-like GNAT family acetyltransferase